jgi:hypothetical protein
VTLTTVTQTSTRTYTITSCAPTVTNCPINRVTTEVITATTAVCPETTGTYTIHKTITCSNHASGCTPGATKTAALTVTVSPLAPSESTTHIVPGCTPGAPGPSDCAQCGPGGAAPTTMVVAVPTAAPSAKCTGNCPQGGNGTVTGAPKPTKSVVTSGVGRAAGWVSGAVAVVAGGVLMAVMGL